MKTLKRYPKAILFDYDGVIASTPEYNYQSWKAAFLTEGVKITRREYYLMEGRGPLLISQILCRAHGIALEKSLEVMQQKEKNMRKYVDQASIYEGVPELLSELYSRGVLLALVTGASKGRIEMFLPQAIRNFFAVLITSGDVIKTKPSPEPYLKAAAILGVTPEESLVVENDPLGIESAKNGGFPCVALTTTLESIDLHQADVIFKDHDALFPFLLNDSDPITLSRSL
jgi:beta-phosphoglucomutase